MTDQRKERETVPPLQTFLIKSDKSRPSQLSSLFSVRGSAVMTDW